MAQFLAAVGFDPLMGTLVVLAIVEAGLATLRTSSPPESASALGALAGPPDPFGVGVGVSAITPEDKLIQERVSTLYLALKQTRDPHVVLGIERGARAEDIDRAYWKRMAELNLELRAAGTEERLDELRRKTWLARETLLGNARPPMSITRKIPAPGPMGDRFDKYEVMEQLGCGGMAEVFLGRQSGIEGFSKKVVIKRMLQELSVEPDMVRMFLEEARVAARIAHPNVVQIFDLGETDGQYYIVMEYVDGTDLDWLVKRAYERRQQVPLPIAAYIVAELCAGLHAVHSHVDDAGRPARIIHRDISTHNVMLSSDGHVKITDFGIAKRTDAATKTEPGTLKGKPIYMAPEYVRSSRADARSDIYAAGLVLHVLVAGRHPLAHASSSEALRAVLACRLPSVDENRAGVPDALKAIVRRATAYDPRERYSSANAMRLALMSFIASQGRPVAEHELASFIRSLRDGFDEATVELPLMVHEDPLSEGADDFTAETVPERRRLR